MFTNTILSILNNLKIKQEIKDKPKEPKKHTTKEISNLIVHGYIQSIAANKSFISELIPIIETMLVSYHNGFMAIALKTMTFGRVLRASPGSRPAVLESIERTTCSHAHHAIKSIAQ